MNRHFYGKSHVPDVKVLNLEVANVSGVLHRPHRIEETQAWEAKIINDELYVKGTSIFTQSTKYGNEREMRLFMRVMESRYDIRPCHLICEYSTRSTVIGKRLDYPIPAIFRC